jgi:hypothetical protein
MHHQTNVPQNKIQECLRFMGIQISAGEIDRILKMEADALQAEAESVLKAGLHHATELRADDTASRHKGKNEYTIAVGNELFAAFIPATSKSRGSILKALQGEQSGYLFNEHAHNYLILRAASDKVMKAAAALQAIEYKNYAEWQIALQNVDINAYSMGKNGIKVLTEAALMGHLIAHRMRPTTALTSDGAGQYVLFVHHQLCWIHAVRIIERLVPVSEEEQAHHKLIMTDLWKFYEQLKLYKNAPTDDMKHELTLRFEQLFEKRKNVPDLFLPPLRQFSLHKNQLLLVLEQPHVAIHNNSSEQDIRTFVIKRKISGGTRSDNGRRARHNLATLSKTCKKLQISFWEFLLDRITRTFAILPLAIIIAARSASPP